MAPARVLALVALSGCAQVRGPAFGARADGDRRARMEASPHFVDGQAQNATPTELGERGHWGEVLRDHRRGGQTPERAVPVRSPAFTEPTAAGLRVTWMGHSALLVEIDGVRVLTDPVWSERASPVQWAGPARFHPPPLAIAALPHIDAVVISHDHYDHLDHHSIQALDARGVRFIVPLGVGAHLERWGVPPGRITELEWWQETEVAGLRIVSTPSQHFSGRGLWDRDATLWSSWALIGPEHRVWFSGDTGPFEAATEIGTRLGPFDLAMIESGAWHPAWGNVHLGPDGALRMHDRVQGGVLMPVHWGTFPLAPHRWDQPIVRLLDRTAGGGPPLLAPVVGQTVSPDQPMVAPFWRDRAAAWRARGEPVGPR